MSAVPRCAVVAIGRNEGERLVRCFESIGSDYPAVYVDSGSTDRSVEEAGKRGIQVVTLSTGQGFTAARARNAGWRALAQAHPGLDYIQFVDGDCEFAPGWIALLPSRRSTPIRHFVRCSDGGVNVSRMPPPTMPYATMSGTCPSA
jgi:glycosyltransferase involved in cell wall biosynthesis